MHASGSGLGASASSKASKPTLLAISGFVVGVLILVAFVGEFLTPSTPSNPTFIASPKNLALLAFRSYAWGLFAVAAIPFFAIVGTVLRPRSVEGAMSATLLSVVGVVLYSLRGIMQDAAWAAASSAVSPSASETAYLQMVLFGMANTLLPLGAAIWGLGYIFFGVLIWKSGIFPNWLAPLAFIGGVAGWAIFPVINSFGLFPGYLFTELLVPFTTAIFGFTCGTIFIKRSRTAGASGPRA